MKTMKKEGEIEQSSKDNTDIFEEGTESPRCAGILHGCLQNLEKKGKRDF